jgi:predicted nucleotidyltransferase
MVQTPIRSKPRKCVYSVYDFLKSLNARRVRYLVIGASAFPTHGYLRTTADIDILIQPTLENARRTLRALADVGYDITELTAGELLDKKILLRQYILATDIHPSVKGARFDTLWRNRVRDKIEGVSVFVASLDDLIKMKRAANRPKDRQDLAVLQEIKKRRKRKK